MVALTAIQDGFLGMESIRAGLGITISYWRDLDSIIKWGKTPVIFWREEKGGLTGINASSQELQRLKETMVLKRNKLQCSCRILS